MNSGRRLNLWMLLLLAAAFVAVFGWWGNLRLRRTLESTVRAELETTLHANVTALEIWVTNQTQLVSLLSSEPELRKLALARFSEDPAALPMPGPRRQAGGPPPWTEASGVDRYLQDRLKPLGHVGLLVGTNMQVLSMFGRGRMGMPVSEEHQGRFAGLFATGEPLLITPFRPRMPDRMRPGFGGGRDPGREPGSEDGPRFRPLEGRRGPGPGGDGPANPAFRPSGDIMLMMVAAPIRDDNGVIRGALALIIDPEKEFSRILSVARFGQTGETYAFDSSGLMISRSRFDDQLKAFGLLEDRSEVTSALTLPLVDPGGDLSRGFVMQTATTNCPLTHSVLEALAGRDDVRVTPARDYRGVPVVAAWQWLPGRDFGVVTQMDAREAFSALRLLRTLFLVLFLLLVLSANGFFFASYLGAGWKRRLSEAELKARRLGQYELQEKIGEGGMGVVYRARHALLRRDTAIKLLLPERTDPESIRHFEREVRLTCQLTHPNTIQVYDYGHTPEGIFYYAMELLQGLNLKDLVVMYGAQPATRVMYILLHIVDALHEAHERGLVHRDIKPANVFLTHRGQGPDAVKVLDFGLVREYRRDENDSSEESLPGDETTVGTPLFMSPESIRTPGRSDPRSDIYSLAALGYYLLVGHPVFEGATPEEVTEKHLNETPVAPSTLPNVQVSPQMEAILLRCLKKKLDERPATVAELKQALLATPEAGQWDESCRANWWREHGPTLLARKPYIEPEAAAPVPSLVQIDRTLRVQKRA
jgi:serine/threonine protein kinase